jgi:hypothetical protein
MMTLAQSSVTLKAGEVRPIAVTASVFSCASADASFNISFNGGAYIPMQAGWTVDNRPNLFTSLILQNPNAVAITIAFYATTCAISYAPVNSQVINTNAPTYINGTGVTNASAGQFNGTDPGTGKKRKQIIVTNLDAVQVLVINDSLGNQLGQVPAGTTWTVETSGFVIVDNLYGINWCVGEVFYL